MICGSEPVVRGTRVPLRTILASLTEEAWIDEILAHLPFHIIPSHYNTEQRDAMAALADYLAVHLEAIRPDEASAARVLRELVRNQRM